MSEAFDRRRAAIGLAPGILDSGESYFELAHVLELGASEMAAPGRARSAPGARPSSQAASELAEAEHAYRTGLRLSPMDSGGYYQLGSMLRSRDRVEEALSLLEVAARLDPSNGAAASSLAYVLLNRGTRSQQRGLQMLAQGVDSGLWARTIPWQHPAEHLASVPAPPRHGLHTRAPYQCVLDPLEKAAREMAAEATALLAHFRVQAEGLSHPRGGWRELNVWRLCGLGPNSGPNDGPNQAAGPIPELRTTCARLREVRALYPYIQGAMFSAIVPNTTLVAHCGPTNGRLIAHVGLSVPQPGAARLHLGRPLSLTPASLTEVRALGLADEEATEITWQEGRGFVWEDSISHEVVWRSTAVAGEHKATPVVSDEAFITSNPRIILLLLLLSPAMTGQQICTRAGPTPRLPASAEAPRAGNVDCVESDFG